MIPPVFIVYLAPFLPRDGVYTRGRSSLGGKAAPRKQRKGYCFLKFYQLLLAPPPLDEPPPQLPPEEDEPEEEDDELVECSSLGIEYVVIAVC